MYDAFSANYDRFVDWDARLRSELPFLAARLEEASVKTVLDAACGTGRHALALAELGYEVTGADPSTGMIQKAREAALNTEGHVRFVQAGFGALAEQTGRRFDALVCLGNSLPHVLSFEKLMATIGDFRRCLVEHGLLLIQNRNFDAVMGKEARWMPVQAHGEDGDEWLFVRFYDFLGQSQLRFNVLTLNRPAGEPWRQHVSSTTLRGWEREEVVSSLTQAGFGVVRVWGDMQGASFDAQESPNLVVMARKGGPHSAPPGAVSGGGLGTGSG